MAELRTTHSRVAPRRLAHEAVTLAIFEEMIRRGSVEMIANGDYVARLAGLDSRHGYGQRTATGH
jgi:hypothetical protein